MKLDIGPHFPRPPKTTELIQPTETGDTLVFDPERDLGETFRQKLLHEAEHFLVGEEEVSELVEEFDLFGRTIPEEAQPDRAIEYLAAHKILFPAHQADLDAFLSKYKVKEVVESPDSGRNFLAKMILFPDEKQIFVQQVDAYLKSRRLFYQKEELFEFGVHLASVKPDELKQIQSVEGRQYFFDLLRRLYAKKDWYRFIGCIVKVRLLFPKEFDTSFLKPEDWESMKKVAVNLDIPTLAMYLAILAAEEVHFLPEGEVRITPRTRGIKSKPELPSRSHV